MGRPILFGLGGEPIAFERTNEDAVDALLIGAFGMASGLDIMHAKSAEEMKAILVAGRERLVVGIVGLPGMKEKLEAHYGVPINVDVEPPADESGTTGG